MTPSISRYLTLAAFLIAGLSFAVSVRFAVYTAAYTDASGYVAESDLWRSGDLVRPVPLQLWASWANAIESASPLGFKPGPTSGTEVPIYPPGFPLMMAGSTWLAGEYGPYLVAPAMGGLMVFTTFLLARRLSGSVAGLLAAALVAMSPAAILNTVYPMSDAPATACWLMAWLFSLKGSRDASVVAGLLAALAILVRPNLAPIGLIVLLICYRTPAAPESRQDRRANALLFSLLAGIGPALLLWTQARLYGGPLQSGYPGAETFFNLSRIPQNASTYLKLWLESYGGLPFIGLAMPLWVAIRPGASTPEGRLLVFSAAGVIALNVMLYLPYLTFDHWPFLRFLLPSTVALFILFAATIEAAAGWLWAQPKRRWLVVLFPLAVGSVAFHRTDFQTFALNEWRAQSMIIGMGHYLREVLPANAVALSFTHSGAIAQYTHRSIVRLDVIDPASLDRVIADIERGGLVPVLVIDGTFEQPFFAERFKDSRLAALDWPPRAEFTSVSTIRYFVPADRDAYLRGERWPIDRVR